MEPRPAPLLPPACDLRDFPRMMIDITRLRASEFDATANDSAWRAGVNLWLSSWHQVPAGSLKDDEAQLAKLAGLGRDLRAWRKVRAVALRGWVECADGRLYHATVAEVALEAWLVKLNQRLKSGAGHASRHGIAFDREQLETDIAAAHAALRVLNPQSRALKRAKSGDAPQPDQAPAEAATGCAPGTPQAVPEARQEKGSEVPPVGAPGVESEAPAKEAWRRGVQLLTGPGCMKDKVARSLLGRILKENRIEPEDLLPSIVKAQVSGTQDPQAYLVAAARAIAERKGASAAPRSGAATWDADQWRTAIRIYHSDGQWSAAMGPRPDEPGCWALPEILAEFERRPLLSVVASGQ